MHWNSHGHCRSLQSPPYQHLPYEPFGRPPSSPYPAVNVTRFRASARSFVSLSTQAEKLYRKIESDKAFAESLQSAAQKNNIEKVKRLLDQLNGETPYKVKYTPDGMKIKLYPKNDQECAALVLDFCW